MVAQVLLVEDHSDSQVLIKAFLKNRYAVTCAANAEEAINHMSNNVYEIILMDIALRDSFGGIELTKYVRSLPNYKDIPIIAVTAYGSPTSRDVFITAGMNDYLAKPFTRDQLLEIIERWKPVQMSLGI